MTIKDDTKEAGGDGSAGKKKCLLLKRKGWSWKPRTHTKKQEQKQQRNPEYGGVLSEGRGSRNGERLRLNSQLT